MPYHAHDDPGFWDIGPESMRWMKVIADAINVKFARFPLGDPEDENTPFASILFMPPGYELWRHKHACYRVEVIIKGSLQVGGRTYGPGDVMTSEPDQAYGPHVAGPDGAMTVEIFSSRRGVNFEFDANPDPKVTEFFRALLADPDAERRAAARIALANAGLE
jgi:hypothetical protein